MAQRAGLEPEDLGGPVRAFDAAAGMIQDMGDVLALLSIVALVVSGFLVLNIVNATVIEQRRQIGIGMALGTAVQDPAGRRDSLGCQVAVQGNESESQRFDVADENVTATDNCSVPTIDYTEVRTDGSCDDTYILTRSWTGTDDCGKNTTKSQVIEVVDTTPPVLAGVPANITVE